MVDERTTGYSIWLMPEGEVFERYNDVIAKVAKENGTPKFEAHVTLLGGIPAEVGDEMVFKKSQELAEGLRPFRITLGGYGMGHVYVQALFLHAETTVALL